MVVAKASGQAIENNQICQEILERVQKKQRGFVNEFANNLIGTFIDIDGATCDVISQTALEFDFDSGAIPCV